MYYQKRNKIYGVLGEFLAIHFYNSKGYKLVYQNLKTKFSEVDLVFSKQNIVKLIEVKLTTNADFDVFVKWQRCQLPKLTKTYQLLKMKYPEKTIEIDFVNFDFSSKSVVNIFHYTNVAPRRFQKRAI